MEGDKPMEETSHIPDQQPNEPVKVEEGSVETQINEDCTCEENKQCLQCNQLEMDLKAAKERNKQLFDNFALYRSSAESNVSSKESEIERLRSDISTQEKEIETLRKTLDDLNKKLIEKDKILSEHDSVVSGLKDELAIERNKNSEISNQFIGLQFKLAQEKATKTIKNTAATVASTFKSISQELFLKKPEPLVLNEGYAQFVHKYERDMKSIERAMKQLEDSYQQVVKDWMQHEEEHKKKESDLMEENKQLMTEKNEIENSLRTSIQTLEKANEEMNEEMTRIRMEYKVSDQVENNTVIEGLTGQVKQLEEEKKQAAATYEQEIATLKEEVNQWKEESMKQQEQLKQDEAKIQEYEDETKETERVLKRLKNWSEEKVGSPKPGLHLEDPVVQTILSRWNVNEGTRQQVLEWCEAYLNQMNQGETKEIVIPAMTQDVLNGFKNIIVPILRARENAEVTAYSRQSTIYEMKVCAGEVHTEEEPVIDQSAEEVTTPVATAENSAETSKTKKRWLWND